MQREPTWHDHMAVLHRRLRAIQMATAQRRGTPVYGAGHKIIGNIGEDGEFHPAGEGKANADGSPKLGTNHAMRALYSGKAVAVEETRHSSDGQTYHNHVMIRPGQVQADGRIHLDVFDVNSRSPIASRTVAPEDIVREFARPGMAHITTFASWEGDIKHTAALKAMSKQYAALVKERWNVEHDWHTSHEENMAQSRSINAQLHALGRQMVETFSGQKLSPQKPATPRTSSTKATSGGKKAPATLDAALQQAGLARLSSTVRSETETVSSSNQRFITTILGDGTTIEHHPADLEALGALVGSTMTPHDAAELFGVPPGARLEIEAMLRPRTLDVFDIAYNISASDPHYEVHGGLRRSSGKAPSLSLSIDNARVTATERQHGIMTEIVGRMALGAHAQGVSRITLSAAGWGNGTTTQTGASGYYAWPRLGFNTPITSLPAYGRGGVTLVSQTFLQRLAASPYKDAKTVANILATPEGREWWLRYGISAQLSFSTTSISSRNMRILLAYLTEKHKASRVALPDAPQQKSNGVDLVLTSEDEAILDRVWAEVTGQHDTPTRLAALRAQVATFMRRGTRKDIGYEPTAAQRP